MHSRRTVVAALASLALASAAGPAFAQTWPTMPLRIIVPGFESGTYQGVMAPAKMSKENVARINAELLKVIHSPAVKEKLHELGADVVTMTPTETSDFVTKERARWAAVIKEAGADIEGAP